MACNVYEVVKIWNNYYGNPEEDLKAAKAIAMGGLGDIAYANILVEEAQIAKLLTPRHPSPLRFSDDLRE
jgi:hypothetical protein